MDEVFRYSQLIFAALGGGAFYKLVDVVLKKRFNDARADKTLSDAAMQHIDRLVSEVERTSADAEQFKKESEQCRKNYEEIRLVVTDLKIALRSVYEYMTSHVDTCPAFEKGSLPKIPNNIFK